MAVRVLLVLAVLASFYGCGQSSPAPEQGEKEAVGEKKPGVGDTQDVGALRVTLVEAFRTDGDKDELYRDQVPPNGTFVVARVRVQNDTPETIKWGKRYLFAAYSTDGRKLNDAVALSRQIDPSVPREDQALYNTQIRPGGDVTGTLVCIAELDEEVSLEFLEGLKDLQAEATWEFGPVGGLPGRGFESQL